jgi:Fe-S-cluster containining protein
MFEYPKNVSFICHQCGRCCGDTEDIVRHILLLKTDVASISNKLLLRDKEFAEEISGFEPYIYEMKKTEFGKCFFLENNTCTIYEIRPLICRFYPFQLENLGNNMYSFSYTSKCMGIGKGSRQKRAFFKNLFSQATNAMEESTKTP